MRRCTTGHETHKIADFVLELRVGNVEAGTGEVGNEELVRVSKSQGPGFLDTYHDKCDEDNGPSNSGDDVDQVPLGFVVLLSFPLRLLYAGW